ncbi:MAG: uroporphyrinogen decarboxylase [Verrucomicrobiota bacterium JB022]|nr:uroporphyrinogen decarboxylase [Verrucomicrobiota bacterium JB022]
MNSRERMLAALACQPVDRPPLWVMRQAGRYLPEYRELKAQHGFLKMVKTPDLAMEVTLQPLRRFALDAAILFSDILVIPEALGQPYRFRDEGGIAMDFRLDSAADIDRLKPASNVREALAYMPAAHRLLRAELPETALLGFVGSPWTLATYMVEGGSSDTYARIKALYYSDRPLFERLMTRVTDAVIELCRMQVEAGADAIQIFDSWAAACPGNLYTDLSLRWVWRVIQALPEGYPVIFFGKGMAHQQANLVATGACCLGLDWTVDLPAYARQLRPDVAVQGNLDPVLMTLPPEHVAAAARELVQSMRDRPGFVVNLGHGITPQARVESMQALVDAVGSFA